MDFDLQEQIAYYRAIASEYEDHRIDEPGEAELLAAVDGFLVGGDVLELACGPGTWTPRLLADAATVTAVEASTEMLTRARARVGTAPVRFIEADLFSWRPDRRYDTVFFGFWLSHVPDDRFDSFWSLVAECVKPDGHVFFVDDNHRTEAELVEGSASPVIERRLNDGTPYRVVKVPHRAEQLRQRLVLIGWEFVVSTAGPFYWGTGSRTRP